MKSVKVMMCNKMSATHENRSKEPKLNREVRQAKGNKKSQQQQQQQSSDLSISCRPRPDCLSSVHFKQLHGLSPVSDPPANKRFCFYSCLTCQHSIFFSRLLIYHLECLFRISSYRHLFIHSIQTTGI